MSKRNYIGLATTFHDSAVAIIDDQGDVRFAEATERYYQNKTAVNVAPDAYQRIYQLINTHCDPDAELHVCHTWSENAASIASEDLAILPDDPDELARLPYYVYRQVKSSRNTLESHTRFLNRAQVNLEYELSQREAWHKTAIRTRKFDHHLTHAATACFTSPFREGVCVIVDGFGERGSVAIFEFKNGRIKRITDNRPPEPGSIDASLGSYYLNICQTCGFGSSLGEEWKVMGLAPYGSLDEELYEILTRLIRVEGLRFVGGNTMAMNRGYFQLYERERKPHESAYDWANVAYTGQHRFEELLFELLNNVFKLGISQNLILGGGCMLNSSATGKILDNSAFSELHVYSAPADDGNALGAAWLAYHQDNPDSWQANTTPATPYLGSEMDPEVLSNAIRFGNDKHHTTGDVERKTAELLADGKIVAWVQGRAEYGPRALGNRSILADPRKPDVKDRINARIKFREEFRPFAPSILHECGNDYFEHYQLTPYMERTLRFRDSVVDSVPGVVHSNQTGRLQSVTRESNPKYYRLIEEFHKITGVPILLNTSFNVMGKPIVHSVEDAMAVFHTSGLDALIVGDSIFLKESWQ